MEKLSTTLYNHKPVGELPVIPNEKFRELCERIAQGDFSQNAKMKATYSFEEHQKNLLNALLQIAKTKLFKNATVTFLNKE